MFNPYTVGTGALVTSRPVEPDDEDFLYEIYKSTRSEEMKLVPWSEGQREAFLRMQFAAQQQFYGSKFPRPEHYMILLDGERVGRLYLSRGESEIKILDITIIPERRGSGLGTPLLHQLISQAAEAKSALNIYVESQSPAVRLFERLGFERKVDDGLNVQMRWEPTRAESAGE